MPHREGGLRVQKSVKLIGLEKMTRKAFQYAYLDAKDFYCHHPIIVRQRGVDGGKTI